jgi:hypothetical protein
MNTGKPPHEKRFTELLDAPIFASFGVVRGQIFSYFGDRTLVSRPRNKRYIVAIKMGRRQGVRREHI